MRASLALWRTCVVASVAVCSATPWAEEGEDGAATEHAHYRYAVAGFVGATRVQGENEPTLGVEAVVALNREWSIGAVIERADRQRDSTLLLIGAGWHPFGPGLRMQVGVGAKDPSGETEAVVRAGLAWEQEIHERWFVKPYVAYDVISNEKNEGVFGVYVGRLF